MKRLLCIAVLMILALGCAEILDLDERNLPAHALWGPWAPDLDGHAARSSTWDQTGANNDNIPIGPGETVTLFEAEGPGIVRHIWSTTNVDGPYGRMLILRMYWDGSETPGVEVPYGDFFGVGHGVEADVQSFPITVNSSGRSRNCWWPMPFSDGARITLTNEGPTPHRAFYCYVDWFALDEAPPTRERFHAQYRQAFPADSPENFVYLETEGEGHYMGVVHSIESTEPQWWGEGDDLIEVDDNEPLRGTGTEDYFSDAWGTREYDQLWHGVPLCEGFDAAGLKTTQYRWHIIDPIPFDERIRVSIEHGTENDREDNHSSVAFWYQVPPAAPFPTMPPVIARLPGDVGMDYLRSRGFQIATGGADDAVERIVELIPYGDDVHAILLEGLADYARDYANPSEEALDDIDAGIAELEAIVEAMPEDERFVAPEIDVPTDPDALIPADAIVALHTLQRVRHDLARRVAVMRGELRPGDEIVLEVRDSMAQLTPPPAFEATSDWTYSYAKVDDVHLMGAGAHFTYGDADPSWARFTPDLPQAGEYEVLVIFSYGGNAADTRWEVRHAGGTVTVPLAQRGRPGTPDRNCDVWHSLGTFRFEAGQSAERGSVTLNVAPGTALAAEQFEYRAYADAVRFVYRGE